MPHSVVDSVMTAKESSKSWNLRLLRAKISEILRHKETVKEIIHPKDKNNSYRNPNETSGARRQHPAFDVSQPPIGKEYANQSEKTKRSCRLCQELHFESNCSRYRSPDERRKRLTQLRLCHSCLGKDHIASQCTTKPRCYYCSGGHHSCLCFSRSKNSPPASGANRVPIQKPPDPETPHPSTFIAPKPVVNLMTVTKEVSPESTLLIAPISMQGKEVEVKTHAVLDSVTSIGFNQAKPQTEAREVFNVSITLPTGDIYSFEAFAIEEICSPISEKSVHPFNRAFESKSNEFEIHLLISNRVFWEVVQSGPQVSDSGHRFIRTIFGDIFLPFGSATANSSSKATCLTLSSNEREKTPRPITLQKIAQFTPDPQLNIKHENDSYTVQLPWKESVNLNIGDMYFLCRSRLASNFNLLKRHGDLQEYHEKIEEMERLGIIRTRPTGNPIAEGRFRYLPHHFVTHPQKGKKRIVFDGSAHTKEFKSLNSLLHKGDYEVPLISTIIQRFRTLSTYLVCDISRAFNNIRISERDQSAMQFLWVQNPELPPTRKNTIAYQFCTLPFGLTCSPYILHQVLSTHLQKYGDFGEAIINCLYVDNFAVGLPKDPKDFEDFFNKLLNCFRSADMKLHEFNTNSSEMRQILVDKGIQVPRVMNFLGVSVDFELDEFIFKFQETSPDEKLSKRVIAHKVNSFFQPIGVAEPTLLKARQMIQRLWKENLPWDSELPRPLRDEWMAFLADWASVEFRLNRRIETKERDTVTLHCFGDASA
uniref:Reverse transcriptase domain-containing protein n=1 Tax=Bursaphelenchus xylophilus TaxID=6326 RepID=A0A1I7SHH4_BURXY